MAVSSHPSLSRYWDADNNAWVEAKKIIGNLQVTLGPQASQQWLEAPDHMAMVLARYRAAAALIGGARRVFEAGAGEGIGTRILAKGRTYYCGIDSDTDAIDYARTTVRSDARTTIEFLNEDVLTFPGLWQYDAAVALDVIEHIPANREDAFMAAMTRRMQPHGVCVIGTPSENAAQLASPQSQVGHVNVYTPDRLKALMECAFYVVQMLYLQDVAIHLGHPGMAHYILAVGIDPR